MLVVSGVIVARVLGVQYRGYLALLVLVPQVLLEVVPLGFPFATTYFVAADPRSATLIVRRLARAYFWQAAAVIALHVGAILLVTSGKPGDVRTAGWISLGLAPAYLAQQYGLAILQGMKRFTAFNLLRIAPPCAYAVATATALVGSFADLTTIVALWMAANWAVALITTAVMLRGLPKPSPATTVPTYRDLATFGLKGLLGSLSPIETFRFDQAVVGLLLSSRALGLYVVALAFTNLPRFISQSIGMLVYPKAAGQGRTDARRTVWRFFAFGTLVSGALSAVLALIAPVLVPVFFGPEFRGAVGITQLLLASAFFASCRRVLADGVNGLGLPGLGSIAEGCSWVFLAVGVAVLLPPLGVRGVALAMAASSFVALAVLVAAALRSGRRARAPSDGLSAPS